MNMKILKVFTIVSVLVISVYSFANLDFDQKSQIIKTNKNDDELDGKTFTGTATEITPPDIDRMPIVYNETIVFQGGKLICESFKKYVDSNSDTFYNSEIDWRRAIAYTVVNFNSSVSGNVSGETVNIEFSGTVIAYKNLSGNLIIRYPDEREVTFFIQAKIN